MAEPGSHGLGVSRHRGLGCLQQRVLRRSSRHGSREAEKDQNVAGVENRAYFLSGNRKLWESVEKHLEQGLAYKKGLVHVSIITVVVVIII